MTAPVKHTLFICYSHTDQKYREQFSKFLGGNPVPDMEIFSDAEIKPGEKWEDRILDRLKAATAALLLVSQDFLVSPFIQRVELREILESHIRRGACSS
jgi:TIR domain-containing protein